MLDQGLYQWIRCTQPNHFQNLGTSGGFIPLIQRSPIMENLSRVEVSVSVGFTRGRHPFRLLLVLNSNNFICAFCTTLWIFVIMGICHYMEICILLKIFSASIILPKAFAYYAHIQQQQQHSLFSQAILCTYGHIYWHVAVPLLLL